MSGVESRLIRLLRSDSYLAPFSDQIRHRLEHIEETSITLHRVKRAWQSLHPATNTSAFISNEADGYFVNGRQTQRRST